MIKTIVVLLFLLFNIGIIAVSFIYAAVVGVGVFDYNFSIFHESTTKLSQGEIEAIFLSIEDLVAVFPWLQVIAGLVNSIAMLVLLVRQNSVPKERKESSPPQGI